ncbi:lysoplasmalogenase family protein [Enemella evansiae]|uniref:lysoplasmalogenase family protein n=1 Tax=Enemella evansiae TaxID=2016499 RepID=UPI000B95E7D0|nr:lysoplasmalogenase family protein [Enemella evansiae]OYN96951.1 lysoplasmalogenase [Enemella evansiae]OYO00616.1 lysoplasmalogenase [Enemella evansiae]OYO06207.1 lysoplasmalogenase [Enemella evansiae]OYO11895.1 lysoplasmalogenase [Enemella evansiae]
MTGLFTGQRWLSASMQVLLMPMLALVAVRLPAGRLRTGVLAALTASWVGDTVPRFVAPEVGLPVLLGCFAVAQAIWVVTLWRGSMRPGRRGRVLATAALALAPSVWVVLRCLPTAGALTPAVIGYAALLLAMVALIAARGPLGVAGGLLFWISDALIAVTTFVPGWRFTGSEVAIMSTYAAAQGLIVAALLRESRPPR